MKVTVKSINVAQQKSKDGKKFLVHEIAVIKEDKSEKVLKIADFKLNTNPTLKAKLDKIGDALEIGGEPVVDLVFVKPDGSVYPELSDILEGSAMRADKPPYVPGAKSGATKAPYTPMKSENPNTQASIQRQNALTNATALVNTFLSPDGCSLEEATEKVIETAHKLLAVHG